MAQDDSDKHSRKRLITRARAELKAHLRAERRRRRLSLQFRADAVDIVAMALADEQAARRARGQEPLFAFCHLAGPDWAKVLVSTRPGTEPHIEIMLTNQEISVKAVGWPADPEINPAPAIALHVRIPLPEAEPSRPGGAAGSGWIPKFRNALARGIADLRL